jgi:hypothetical protein
MGCLCLVLGRMTGLQGASERVSCLDSLLWIFARSDHGNSTLKDEEVPT